VVGWEEKKEDEDGARKRTGRDEDGTEEGEGEGKGEDGTERGRDGTRTGRNEEGAGRAQYLSPFHPPPPQHQPFYRALLCSRAAPAATPKHQPFH